ncbi:MAG: proteasome accessory factor PafA2 family protein, partial [Planctomycetes bacterium]|nr:proteasome accessory factor PafA2 family protein [Planctomycetota bacterium]
ALRRTVDWWAKKEMLDASLAGETSWEEIAPWGRLIESLEARANPPGPGAEGWEGLLGRLDEGVRRRASESMEGLGLDPARGSWAHGIVSRLRKIDQKYHQVIPGDGYHRRLDREGLLRSEVGTEALLRAALEAPRGTRARGRSSFVRRHAGRRGAAATWGSCVLERPRGRSVLPLADPFDEAVDRAERFA